MPESALAEVQNQLTLLDKERSRDPRQNMLPGLEKQAVMQLFRVLKVSGLVGRQRSMRKEMVQGPEPSWVPQTHATGIPEGKYATQSVRPRRPPEQKAIQMRGRLHRRSAGLPVQLRRLGPATMPPPAREVKRWRVGRNRRKRGTIRRRRPKQERRTPFIVAAGKKPLRIRKSNRHWDRQSAEPPLQ
jgi:hypothetical protein